MCCALQAQSAVMRKTTARRKYLAVPRTYWQAGEFLLDIKSIKRGDVYSSSKVVEK